jgi:hypothetical protein
LESNKTVEASVLGLVNHTQTTTELFEDAVMGDGLPDE